MSDVTPPDPRDEAVTGELVPHTEDPRDALLEQLAAKVADLEAAQPEKPKLPKIDGALEGVYTDEGVAKAEAIPLGCPILSSGSQDPTVATHLVPVLNYALGLELVQGDAHVTPEVIGAVKAFRNRYGVPAENLGFVENPENYIGPNTWAAIAAVNRARTDAATKARDEFESGYTTSGTTTLAA